MKLHIFLFSSCCALFACTTDEEDPLLNDDATGNSESSIENVDPINYESLQGEWKIVEIHSNDTALSSVQSIISDEDGPTYAGLYFYRPTLGDPARLEMGWNCDGLGFSYEYDNNWMTRIGDVGGPLGPWGLVNDYSRQINDVEPLLSCIGPPTDRAPGVSSLMASLAARLTMFDTYKIEFQSDESIVSIFTIEGDGIYASRP